MVDSLYDGCNLVAYASGYITDTDNSTKYLFANAISDGINYNIKCNTIGHLESWSSGTVTFTGGIASYSFDAQSKIFGSNGTSSGEFYAGDANQDGAIDGADISEIDNDVFLSSVSSGWLATDLNYDGMVDATDLTICDNNVISGRVVMPGCSAKNPFNESEKKIKNNPERVKINNNVKSMFKEVIGN
ncbi:MAG: dockerin type I domain-containing protein [Ignavibacteria bacterium]|nr:dockerin type I domain-containing protein [Ignavibacteria bacterium]